MIYIACPTCGYFIGNKIETFEKGKENICNNIQYSEEEQGIKIKELIDSLKIRRYCCRMRLMTCKDIVQDILPNEN
jgi:DNA-directed RNA polymerase subunit N (RpoN/RPB10)